MKGYKMKKYILFMLLLLFLFTEITMGEVRGLGITILNLIGTADEADGYFRGGCTLQKLTKNVETESWLPSITDGCDVYWDYNYHTLFDGSDVVSCWSQNDIIMGQDTRPFTGCGYSDYTVKLCDYAGYPQSPIPYPNKLQIYYRINNRTVFMDYCYEPTFVEDVNFISEYYCINLESNSFKYGTRINLVKTIVGGYQHGFPWYTEIELKDMYSRGTGATGLNSYAELKVSICICSQWLYGDINGDGKVNNLDLIIIGKDYGKSGEGLEGDITGIDGIPDGFVNIWDMAQFCYEYLQ